MIGLLLRKDPAIRALPLAVLIVLALGLLWAVGAQGMSEVPGGGEDLPGLMLSVGYLQVLVAIVLLGIIGKAGVRLWIEEWQLVLPVPLRTLLGLRLFALLLLGCAPIALVTGLWAWLGPPALDRGLLLASGASLSLAWAVFVVLSFVWRARQPRIGERSVFLLTCVLGIPLGYASLQWPVEALPFLLATALIALAWSLYALPHGFDLEAPARRGMRLPRVGFGATRRPLAVWIRRSTWLRGLLLALLAMAAFAGSLEFQDGPLSLLPLMVFAHGGLFVWVSTRVLRECGHLPVPRARLARSVFLPALAVLLFLVAFAAARDRWWDDPLRPDIRLMIGALEDSGEPYRPQIRVLPSQRRPAVGLHSRVVTAPWGESVAVAPVPLMRGVPVGIWNPYEVDPDSSIDFVAWQLSRAIEATYGVHIEPDELRERYLSLSDGSVHSSYTFGRDLHRGALPFDRQLRPGLFGFSTLVVVLGWAIGGFLATRSEVRRGRRSRIAVLWTPLVYVALIALAWIPIQWQYDAGHLDMALAGAFVEHVGPEWLLFALAGVLAIVCYRGLVRRFERMEVPPPLPKPWWK